MYFKRKNKIKIFMFLLQAFHLCHFDGRKETFLCPPGTRFDMVTHECSPWYITQCVGI